MTARSVEGDLDPRTFTRRVWRLNGLLAGAVGAFMVYIARDLDTPASPTGRRVLPAIILAAMFALAEVMPIHLQRDRDAHSFSVGEVPLVVGLFAARSPVLLIGAQAIGLAIALHLHRRQGVLRLVFNLLQTALSTACAVIIADRVARLRGPLDTRAWLVVLAAVGVASVIGAGLVAAVIAIRDGSSRSRSGATLGLAVGLANACVGLIAAMLYETRPAALILLLIPMIAAVASSRAYVRQRRRQQGMELLMQSAALVVDEPTTLDLERLLERTRQAFACEIAELWLNDGVRRRVDSVEGTIEDIDPLSVAPIELVNTAPATILGRPQLERLPDGFAERRRWSKAMVAPVPGTAEQSGLLIVANPLSAIADFDQDDLRVLITFARHLGIALEHSILERRAHRDPLTGLANRTRLIKKIETTRETCALLFIDVDDFKRINDDLGHHVGDAVLIEIAHRLERCVSDGDLVARLGGDEFAIFLTGAQVEARSELVALAIVESIRVPLLLDDQLVSFGASVGLATTAATQGGSENDAADLMRRADAAMYGVKRQGKGAFGRAGHLDLRTDRPHATKGAN